MPALIGIEILPEWLPSPHRMARFNLLIRAASGVMIRDLAATELDLFDAAGTQIGTELPALDRSVGPLAGPGWRQLTGRLLKIDDSVVTTEAMLDGVRSPAVDRRDASRRVTLRALGGVGIPSEPRLWWRFYNDSDEPIEVATVLGSAILLLDGTPRRLAMNYNGPATLPPRRAVSGLWPVLELSSHRHEAQLEILGERSEPVVLEPPRASGTDLTP